MFFEWNNVKIYYEYHPHNTAVTAPVLFLHGWGCDHSVFDSYTCALKRECSILLVDFPGHGQSDETHTPWCVGDFASQIIALLDELKIDKVRIFAHSFGGRVAIKLGSQHPERVESLVITGGAGIKKQRSRKQKIKQKAYKLCQAALNLLKRIPVLTKQIVKIQNDLRNRNSSPDYLKLSDAMKKTFVLVVNEDLTNELSAIQAPTLLLWGSSDTETPLWMGETMRNRIPDSGLVVLENGSHFAFLEQKDRCLAILKNYWQVEGQET